MAPAPPVPGSANPANPLTQPADPPLSPPAPVARPGYPDFPLPAEAGDGALPSAQPAPAGFGGNVGPVGSEQERAELGIITGQPVTSATQLLLGPVVRGMTVSPAQPDPEDQPR